MNADSYFVDTNVLLYSYDRRDPVKHLKSGEWVDHLWASGMGRISWQVLHEFYSNVIRKAGVPVAEARDAVIGFAPWHPGGADFDLVQRAWYWMDRAQLSYWDALIMASAHRQGCRWLLSEDFQHGRDYEGVRVINPFTESPPSIIH
jgi:predicted nucleic acid-binding protein